MRRYINENRKKEKQLDLEGLLKAEKMKSLLFSVGLTPGAVLMRPPELTLLEICLN